MQRGLQSNNEDAPPDGDVGDTFLEDSVGCTDAVAVVVVVVADVGVAWWGDLGIL